MTIWVRKTGREKLSEKGGEEGRGGEGGELREIKVSDGQEPTSSSGHEDYPPPLPGLNHPKAGSGGGGGQSRQPEVVSLAALSLSLSHTL